MTDPIQAAATALYDRFTHEGMDRRAFMAELTRLAGGAAAAGALLAGIAPQAAAAPLVSPDHPRLIAREETLAAGRDRLSVYRVHRAGAARASRAVPQPAVIVIHENRGLNDHVRDVARRLALQGFDAVAPDFLSLDGGRTPADEDAARQAIGALDLARVTAAGAGLARTLRGAPTPRRPARRRQVGTIGFCWGGATVHRLALAAGDDLGAAISFYGPAPNPAEVARLRSPLLVILAGRDDRVNRTAAPYVAAAESAGKQVRAITYPDVDHAFHNDTSAARYNRAAADQAWQESLLFLRRHLR